MIRETRERALQQAANGQRSVRNREQPLRSSLGVKSTIAIGLGVVLGSVAGVLVKRGRS